MNKQGPNGIQYLDYTWNMGGCTHECAWKMPDGSVAICYAKRIAVQSPARKHYPEGFEQRYWHDARLEQPLKIKKPSRIGIEFMGDLFMKDTPEEQIYAILDVVRRAHWHTFLALTKNAPRLLQFRDALPANLQVGVSMPPTFMFGNELTLDQQRRYVERAQDVLAQLPVPVRWWSFEPVSWDVAPLIDREVVQWAVIGAASNGSKKYQPERHWIIGLLDKLDRANVPVWMKNNLEWSPRRMELPEMRYQSSFLREGS